MYLNIKLHLGPCRGESFLFVVKDISAYLVPVQGFAPSKFLQKLLLSPESKNYNYIAGLLSSLIGGEL